MKTQKREVPTAARDHACWANCNDIIPKGEYYIKDVLMETAVRPNGTRTLMTIAWHMKCAPLTKIAARDILEYALEHGLESDTQRKVEA